MMPNAKRLRELEKEKGEYLIWSGAHGGAFRVDAIIVSIEKWKGIPRQRAVVDREGMSQLFKMLGFRVTVLVDKSADELKAELKDISNKNISEEFSNCFVCFVSAYGSTGSDGRQFILDNEGDQVYVVEDIIEPFITCKALDGKPKIFFINSCIRKFDVHTFNSVAGEPSNISRNTKRRHPSKDLLEVFSTEEEIPDGLDPRTETYFVPALIDSLHQSHDDKDVREIVNEANRCQTVSVKSTLDHKLFWKTRRLEDLPGACTPRAISSFSFCVLVSRWMYLHSSGINVQ